MKNFFMIKVAVVLGMVAAFSSCSKEVMDEEDEEGSTLGTGNSRLEIVTRADDDASLEVAYPVQVYVLNSSNKCIAVKTIEDASETVSLAKLKAGTYTVLAVGGAQADVYELPTQAAVSTSSLIKLKSGAKHNDLMTAQSTVNMGEGETNKLTLSMERKVFLLESVIIKQIPTTVKSVSVTLSPLREHVAMDGAYSGEQGTYTVALTKQSDNTTWKSTGTEFLLPSVGYVSIKISMTRNDNSVSSFTYTANEAMVANYKMSIDGTYGGDDFDLEGVLTGVAWIGSKTITFNFDADSSSPADNNNDNADDNGDDNNDDNNDPTPVVNDPTVVVGAAPALGSDYNGALVVSRSEPAADGSITVKLLAPKQTSVKVDNSDSQSAIKTKVETGLESIKVAGIEGWRVPTQAEIDDLVTNINTVNSWLSIYTSYTAIADITSSTQTWYYIQTDDGSIMTYNLKISVDQVRTPSGSNSLRAITTYTFKPNN